MRGRLTSLQNTDSPAHLDERSKLHHVFLNSRFDLLSPQTRYICFRKKSTATWAVYTTVVLGQPARLSKEKYLCAGADWLSSSEGGGRSLENGLNEGTAGCGIWPGPHMPRLHACKHFQPPPLVRNAISSFFHVGNSSDTKASALQLGTNS